MTPSRLSSRWMYAQSGRARPAAPRWPRRGAGKQPGLERRVVQLGRQRPAESALSRPPQIAIEDTVPTPTAHALGHRLVGQSLLVPESQNLPNLPHQQPPCRHRLALLSKGPSVPQSGYRRAFTIPGTDVPLPPDSTFHFPDFVFHFLESIFHFLRIPCSTSSGIGIPLDLGLVAAGPGDGALELVGDPQRGGRRHYPASPVLRASPPPSPARPDPRGLSVGACHATGRASRVASIPLFHACRRHYPGGAGRCMCRSLPGRWQPSPYLRRVGLRVTRFEACSAFTRVAARMVAEPPTRPFVVGVLRAISLPPSSAPSATGWSDSCRAGFAPAGEWRLRTAH